MSQTVIAREKVEIFAELLTRLISDHTPATMVRSGSIIIRTEFDGQPINIIVTAARRKK
jgi:hypothetical protein